MKKEEIILIGGGGHCKSCIDVLEAENKFRIAGIVDIKDKLYEKVLDYEIIATDKDFPALAKSYKYFLITLGQIENPQKRIVNFKNLKKLGVNFPVIVSPLAYISKYATIDEGTIIMHRAFINSHARIGKNVIINTGSVIEHDTVVGNHCHIATRSVLNGSCVIGDKTFIGSNSVISNNVLIGENIIVGAGAVVVKSINVKGRYAGNPARRLRGNV